MAALCALCGLGRMWLVVLCSWPWGGPGRLTMFEELEHKKTPEEKRLLALEVVGAVIACAVLGATAFWFFDYFGKY